MRHAALPVLAVFVLATTAHATAPGLDRAVEGARLYRADCAPCHEATGGGEAWLFDPPPPDLRTRLRVRHDPDALVQRILGAPATVVPSPAAPTATRTDAIVDHVERLPRVDWPLANRGRTIYIDRCERCHGRFGRPGPPAPDAGTPAARDLTAASFPVDDDELGRLIRHERPGMPPLPASVSDADVRALVAFVRLLSPGYETYELSCAGCHGEEGIPPRGGRHATVVFDRAYFAKHDTPHVRSKVWHMVGERKTDAMPHFRGRLTEPQARAIVAYLQLLAAE